MAETPVIHLCESSDAGRDCAQCGVRIYGMGCSVKAACALWQRSRAERAEQCLADIVAKATEYGLQDDDFVASYILPTGPLHRAIPLLAEQGVHVRPKGASDAST